MSRDTQLDSAHLVYQSISECLFLMVRHHLWCLLVFYGGLNYPSDFPNSHISHIKKSVAERGWLYHLLIKFDFVVWVGSSAPVMVYSRWGSVVECGWIVAFYYTAGIHETHWMLRAVKCNPGGRVFAYLSSCLKTKPQPCWDKVAGWDRTSKL